jgi:hypothetical protein
LRQQGQECGGSIAIAVAVGGDGREEDLVATAAAGFQWKQIGLQSEIRHAAAGGDVSDGGPDQEKRVKDHTVGSFSVD